MIRSNTFCSSLVGNWTKPIGLVLARGFQTENSERTYCKPPKLSIPLTVNTTLKFASFARALQNDVDYQSTYNVSNRFMESKEAERLQSLLEARAYKLNNWLTPWWIDDAYLCQRTPLPFHSSPAAMFPKFNYSSVEGQVDIAAKIIHSALKYYKQIINDELEQDKYGEYLLCMNQYKQIFGTTRTPAHGKDVLLYGNETYEQSKHIIVLRNGHIFRLSVFDSEDNMLSVDQLKHEIEKNILPASQQSNAHPVSVVSSDERGVWADVYAQLREKNGDRVKMIEDSLFAVCLDRKMSHIDGSNDIDIQTHQCLHGGGCRNNSINRWYDKTLQFIIGTDGYCGLSYEHAPAEMPPVSRMMEHICDEINEDNFSEKNAAGGIEPTIPITFAISDEDKAVIANSKKNIDSLAADTDIKVFTFDHFGKEYIKKHGISPDSYIQIALQVAYYRVYHRLACTYETATLRRFSDGRTENIRSPNFHTAMFTLEMNDPDKDIDRPSSLLTQMFRIASQQHTKYMHQAMDGKGIDRHLYGLMKIAEQHGYPVPSLCQTEAFKKMMAFTLSTSQVPTRNFIPVAFGPSAPDCYGICYNPQPEQFHFTICALNSCLETSSSRYAEELENALIDIRTIMEKEYQEHFQNNK